MAEDILITRTVHKIKNLDNIHLLANQVLVQTITDNQHTTSDSGIIKTSAGFWKNQYLALYVNRVHRVIKVCDYLTFWSKNNKTSGNCLRWKTTLDVNIGDVVWSSYTSVINYDALIIDNKEFKLLNYGELRMAQKPNRGYVLLNGWNLYVHPQIARSSILIDPKPVIEYNKGAITVVGKRNQAYIVNDKKWVDQDGDYDLQVGDVFLKHNEAHRLALEDNMFNVYPEKNVYLIQRKDIIAILK